MAREKKNQKTARKNGPGMTVQEYRQMKADDPFKPTVISPAKKGKK